MDQSGISHGENGYRTLDSLTAYETAMERLARAGVQVFHQSLSPWADLGFFGDIFLGRDTRPGEVLIQRMNFGKGRTEGQAHASGIFELAERLSAAFSPDVPVVEGSYGTLRRKGYPLVDLQRFVLPSTWNLESEDFFSSTVTTRYAHNLPLKWYRAEDLFDGSTVYLPICLTHTVPIQDAGNHIYHNRPNGLSAGSSREEALLAGLLELVERDGAALFALHSLPLPEVIADTLPDHECLQMVRGAKEAGLTVVIKDLTTDLAIPTFCVLLQDQRPGFPRNSAGIGTHFDKRIALSRALTEACLDRMHARFQYENMQKVDPRRGPAHLRWETLVYRDRTFGGPRYRPDYFFRPSRKVDFKDIPTYSFETITQAMERLLSVFDRAGIRWVYAADLDRYGIPVVKTVAPQLEFVALLNYEYRGGRSPRGRRLFQAPVRMGYKEGKDYMPLSGLKNDLLL